ncbi:MAG: extracellular solute-binding protein [Chloroflexota bacterium]|nr:extracellular solute-binding protein [Chloroflexota bacterium]MDE2909214.1 extracellular solute-binding protein [Chloroflexota bacterium]
MTENRYSRRVKKLALFIMVAALLGSLSLGAVVAQDATDILVWSLGYGGDYDDTLVERFNEANDDVQITFEDVLTGTFTENNQKVRIALENEAGPHVLGGVDVGANLQALVSTGQVRDLTEYYRASGLIDRIPPNLLAQVTVEGRIYAIPQNMESVGIFYNKDLFAEMELDVPSEWAEYIDVLEAVKDAGYYGYTMGLAGGWPSALMASMFMYSSAGSEYIDVLSGTQPWTDCDNCLDGLNAFYGMVENGYANPEPLGIDYDQSLDLFYQGINAMVLNGPWFIDASVSAAPDFEIGFFYLPAVNPNTDIKTLGGIGGSIIIAEYADVDAAFKVVDWLTSEAVAVQALREAFQLPAFSIEVPEDIDPLTYQIASETAANVDKIGFWPVTYLPPKVFGDMNQIVQGMIGGMLTPEEFMSEMQETHSTYLAEN